MGTPTLFTAILGVLIAITVVLFIVAQNVVDSDPKWDDARVAQTIQERLTPVGKLNTSGEPIVTSPVNFMSEAQAAPDYASGEAVYAAVCQACHSTGVLNSPKLGDPASWGDRLAKDKETLYQSVLNGLNLMPPRGGRPDLSGEQIRMAVDYMLDSLN